MNQKGIVLIPLIIIITTIVLLSTITYLTVTDKIKVPDFLKKQTSLSIKETGKPGEPGGMQIEIVQPSNTAENDVDDSEDYTNGKYRFEQEVLSNNDFHINDYTQTNKFDFTDTIYESQRLFYMFYAQQGQKVNVTFKGGATLYKYTELGFIREKFITETQDLKTVSFTAQTSDKIYFEIERTGLPTSNSSDMSTMKQSQYTLGVYIE